MYFKKTETTPLEDFERDVKRLEEDYLNLKKCLDLAKEGKFKEMADFACTNMDTCQRNKIPRELWPKEYS